MVERIVYDVLQEGLAWFTADDGQRLERFLIDEKELSIEEAARARLFFAGGEDDDGNTVEARPPTLIHGYARTGGPFPCWALTLGAERVATDYLGRDAEYLDSDGENYLDPETGDVVDPKVRRMEYTFNILVIADHPDVVVWYYHLLKFIVVSSMEELEKRNVEELTFSGADMVPDPRYLPSDVFARTLTLTVQGDETWAEKPFARGQGKPKTVAGIALDENGEGTVGGTPARITPY